MLFISFQYIRMFESGPPEHVVVRRELDQLLTGAVVYKVRATYYIFICGLSPSAVSFYVISNTATLK